MTPAAPDARAARQARRRSGLRKNSAAICVMLLVQYGLGMGVNLYAEVPAADHGTGLAAAVGRTLTSQPAVLATHTAVGLLMLVAGITVLVRAIRTRHRGAIAASAAGLAAIIAAAFSGAAFVSSEQAGASMAMAVLTGVALLCYLANLLMVGPEYSGAENRLAAEIGRAAEIKELEMHTETVTVYFDDLDAMGVVHNGRYVTLFERALAGYWTRAGWPYDPGQPRFAEVLFAVREFSITYHVPIARVGTVRVRFWLDRLGTSSLIYGFQVLSDDESVVHAEGRRVQVRLDPVTLRPGAIGPELREACRQLLVPYEGPRAAA